jgi:predicted ATPase/DNA-binding SARP family transcriptional activator/tetratricopeptide (TPR) repeat protein
VTIELTLLSRVCCRGVEITGSRLRGLLALLAGDPGTGCSTAKLVDGLWPDDRPEHPVKALQLLVTRARARLGSEVIVSTPTGYRLSLRVDEIDAAAILLDAAAGAGHARAGDHSAALAAAEAGLALCEGAESWDTAPADPLSALRAARLSTYRSLVRVRALALAGLGRHAEAVEPLTELFGERPRDEEVLVELLRCEAATMGPSTALARYDSYRRALRAELGSDPGPVLQDVHRELLRGAEPVARHGVPHEPNQLLGRAEDITAVANLLRSSRVTSIVGTGGLGKTRLAHVVSREAEQRVVYLVALAGVTSDDDVVDEVASVLGVGESARGPLAVPTGVLTGIADVLGDALLVLDNCEHVLGGAAELVRALVSMSKDLRVLTTSRAPLGLSSEAVYLLPELDLSTTVELFDQRAGAARSGVDLPTDVVRELCGHLDGLPLAVELAAARVRVMSVTEIARGLDDRFALLRGGARDAPRRHRTLHAVIDWSWHLLEPAERAAMRALSVFPGGFTADAARRLLDEDEVLWVVERLVDQSLLKVTDTASGTRFRMLETVREFSTAAREEAGETDRVTHLFLAWARDFGVAHHESLFGPELVGSVARISAEQDNLVQALRHGLDRGDGATVAATSAVLAGLWIIESNFTRLAALATQTAWELSHFRPEPALVEATRTAVVLCAVSGFLLGGPRPVRALVAMRRLPPATPSTLVRAIDSVSRALIEVPATDSSALPMLCDSEDPLVAGVANEVASYLWENDFDLDSALKAARRMLTAFENQETPWIRALAHGRIGELCLQLGRGEEALPHMTAALSVVEELGAWTTVARGRWAMAIANLQRGAIDEAEHWLAQATRSVVADESGMVMADFAVRAEILLARGDVEAGLRLWRRAAERLRNTENGHWALEVQAVTVVAHGQHGRLDLVEEIVGELAPTLSRMIASPATTSTGSCVDFPVCGALMLAVAMVDLDRGDTASTARMIALAEHFRFLRGFQPTMSPVRARRIAEEADRPAYLDAVSSYAGLRGDALRAAASAVLLARVQPTGRGSRLNSARALR